MRRQRQTPLDLIPIMGLMTLLIPLLLMGQGGDLPFSTVDVEAPGGCGCGAPHDGEPALVPSVVLEEEHILVQGDGLADASFGPLELESLSDHLESLKAAHTTTGAAIIVSEDNVRYQQLIAVMDAVQPHFPSTKIAGGVL